MSPRRWLILYSPLPLLIAITSSCTSKPEPSASGSGGAKPNASSTSSTSQVSAGSASTSSFGDKGPIICDDPHTNITQGACDLLQQNCPFGQTCRPVPDDSGAFTTACQDATGLKGEGERCYSRDECLAHFHCLIGRCTPVCCRLNDEPCAGGRCNLKALLKDNHWVQICHYTQQCYAFAPESCPPGQNCYIEDVAQALWTCSAPSVTPVPELGECHHENDCGSMQHCLPIDKTKGICYYYCDLSKAKDGLLPAGKGGCPPAESCTYKANFGMPNLGLCIPEGDSVSSSSATGAGAP